MPGAEPLAPRVGWVWARPAPIPVRRSPVLASSVAIASPRDRLATVTVLGGRMHAAAPPGTMRRRGTAGERRPLRGPGQRRLPDVRVALVDAENGDEERHDHGADD